MNVEEIKTRLNVAYFNEAKFTNEQKQRILWVKYFEMANKLFVYEYNFLQFCNEVFNINYNDLK